MPFSSAIVAGAQGLASQYNNLRTDAITLTETVTAGEAFSATTTVSGVTLPTVLYQDTATGKFLRVVSTATGSGQPQSPVMAYEASAGDGSSVRVYLPGSVIAGTGLTAGTPYYPSTTAGGLTTLDATTLLAWRLLGFGLTTTSFLFLPGVNTTHPGGSPYFYSTSGEALSRGDLCYLKASDGRFYKADGDASGEAGWCKAFAVADIAASGAGVSTRFIKPGNNVTINGTYAAGNLVYPSTTAGQVSATRSKWYREVGIATSSSNVYLFAGKDNDAAIVESVTAGANWGALAHLYLKASDARWYPMDVTVAESGIAEKYGIAVAAHTAGAGSTQLVYLQGSIIDLTFSLTAGATLYSTTAGAGYQMSAPSSYDTFYRAIGYMLTATRLHLAPQGMEFLQAGVQEKGYCGGKISAAGGAGNEIGSGVNFKKIMSNTPSSITFTAITSTNVSSGPTATGINRFGFLFSVITTASIPTTWNGTYQTVGN